MKRAQDRKAKFQHEMVSNAWPVLPCFFPQANGTPFWIWTQCGSAWNSLEHTLATHNPHSTILSGVYFLTGCHCKLHNLAYISCHHIQHRNVFQVICAFYGVTMNPLSQPLTNVLINKRVDNFTTEDNLFHTRCRIFLLICQISIDQSSFFDKMIHHLIPFLTFMGEWIIGTVLVKPVHPTHIFVIILNKAWFFLPLSPHPHAFCSWFLCSQHHFHE